MSYILYFVSRTTISPTDGSVDRETGLDICKPGISGQAGPSGTLDVCESGYNGQTEFDQGTTGDRSELFLEN